MSGLWVLFDFETSGLDKKNHEILEVTSQPISKKSLLYKGTALDLLMVHEQEPPMEPLVLEMHTKSGLLAELQNVRALLAQGICPAGAVLNYAQLDEALYDHFGSNTEKKRSVYLVGNSVSFDHGFIEAKCPRAFTWLSHRVVDVSQVRTMWQAWVGDLVRGTVPHRSRGDIEMSLSGLQWARLIIEAGALVVGPPNLDFARAAFLAKAGDSSL